MSILHDLTSRHALLAIGFCLMFFGVVLRNQARSTKRSLDYQKQHSLHHTTVAEASAETAKRATVLEKYSRMIANSVVALGMLAVGISFFRD